MVKMILVAVDGSDQSLKALRVAIREAKVHTAALHAVYVQFPVNLNTFPVDFAFGSTDTTLGLSYEVVYELLEAESAAILQQVDAIAKEEAIDVTMHTEVGDARSEIIALAGRIGADLIVLGSTGKSGVDRLLIGSVSSSVVEHSPVSTLVVR
jgi:nucleotide-binding universal stress UspA family protein